MSPRNRPPARGAALLVFAFAAVPAHASGQGVGPCGVQFSRVDYDQVGADDGSRELVELRASDVAPGQTLGSCGITRLVPWDGDACAPEAAARAVELSSVVVPASGYVVLSRAGASTAADATASSKSGAWLENGPDLLVLEGPAGPLIALAYGGKTACAPAEVVFAGADVEAVSGPEHWLVACPDGWRRETRAEAKLRAAPSCPALGAAGATGAPAGSGGSGGAGRSGATEATCAGRLSKLDVTQPGGDRAEAIEIEFLGQPPPGTLARDCGVERVVLFNANSEENGCGALAGSYLEREIGGLPIPPSGRLVIGHRTGADRPLTDAARADVVQPGPDYVVLVGGAGEQRDAVMYASPTGAVATCALEATHTPADPPGQENRVLVRCDGAEPRWLAAPESAIAWRAPVVCPDAGYSDAAGAPLIRRARPPSPPSARADASASAPRDTSAEGGVQEESASAGCAASSGQAAGGPLVLAWLTMRTLLARGRRARGRSRRAPCDPPRRG